MSTGTADLESFIPSGVPDHGTIHVDAGTATIEANGKTDWFFKPDGTGRRAENVPKLTRQIDAPIVSLSARVDVDFASRYDAGALFVAIDGENWAKIAYEYSAASEPTIVSVVTRTTSDDADGVTTSGEPLYLRVYTDSRVVALHFSRNRKIWKFVRVFTLPEIEQRPITIGLGAQSPTGQGVLARFSEVVVSYDKISDFRNGS